MWPTHKLVCGRVLDEAYFPKLSPQEVLFLSTHGSNTGESNIDLYSQIATDRLVRHEILAGTRRARQTAQSGELYVKFPNLRLPGPTLNLLQGLLGYRATSLR